MFRSFFIIFLLISLFIEATIVPFPFFVLVSILFFLFYEEALTIIIIFLASLVLDRMIMQHLATTAIFLFAFFLSVIFLEKIFTVRLSIFVAIGIIVIGVEVYRVIAGYPFLWGFDTLVIGTLLLFALVSKKIFKQEKKIYA